MRALSAPGCGPGVRCEQAHPQSRNPVPSHLVNVTRLCASRARQATARSAASTVVLAPPATEPPPAAGVAAPPDPEQLAAAADAQRLVRVSATALGRGLVATHQLDRQCIVSVPLENAMIISDDPMSSISVFGDRCQEQWQLRHGRLPTQLRDFLQGEARWDVRMTAWLLWVATECMDSPIWGPYIQLLPPADEVSCLLNYGPQEAKELQFKELIDEAKSQNNWANSVHRRFFDPKEGELASLRLAQRPADTFWAMSMVRTRTFSECVNGEGLTLMVPYADLANHSFKHNSTFCMARDNKRFELRVLQTLAPGAEATISYGEAKPNFEVMRDYGFVVPANPNDRITLPSDQPLASINGGSLLESIGFTGDWREDSVGPRPEVWQAMKSQDGARVTVGRRRCAVLSLPLNDGFSTGAASQSGSAAAAGNATGRRSFFELPTRAWTDSGRPPPQPLAYGRGNAAAERTRVGAIRTVLEQELQRLPTDAATDTMLLQGATSGDVALSALAQAAVRCRLEHKLLMLEALFCLETYDAWLAARVA